MIFGHRHDLASLNGILILYEYSIMAQLLFDTSFTVLHLTVQPNNVSVFVSYSARA